MKSKKSRNFSRKNKKGGFFGYSKVASSSDCDVNNLSSITDSASLHQNYQKCCPKGFMGRKNSSPYCKQLDLNFQAALKRENDEKEYQGYQPDEVYQMKQQEATMNPPKKSWYKFWGGKTRKYRKRTKKNRTYRRR
jgi:hypothetical protein